MIGLLLALVLAPQAKAGDVLALAVREGATVQKKFKLEHELAVQEIQMRGTGIDLVAQQQIDLLSTVELEVSDAYRKLSGGRPRELQRIYKAAGYHVDFTFTGPSGGKAAESWDAVTPLKSKSVVFTWIPEEQSYSRHYDEVEAPEECLAALDQELDLLALLPGKPVKEGESWALDPPRLAEVFAPGGNVPMSYIKSGRSGMEASLAAGIGAPLHGVFGGTTKGNGQAKWASTKTEEGVRLAVVEIAITIETEKERTEAARRMFRQDDDDEGSPAVRHAGVQWKFAGSGTLLWNLDAGRFEKLELVGREDITSDIQLVRAGEEAGQRLSMAGSLKVTAKASEKKP